MEDLVFGWPVRLENQRIMRPYRDRRIGQTLGKVYYGGGGRRRWRDRSAWRASTDANVRARTQLEHEARLTAPATHPKQLAGNPHWIVS